MIKSSLLEILSTFSKQELLKFEDFLKSPYFNKKPNVVKLFLEIRKHFPGLSEHAVKKETVWGKIFPDENYNYGIMKNLIFDLNKLAEQFISQLKFDKDVFKGNEYLMTALCDRELKKTYISKFKSFSPDPDLKIINENNLQITDHINYVYKMYYLKTFFHHQYDQNFKMEELTIIRDSSLITNFLILLFSAFNDIAAIKNYQNLEREDHPVIKLLNALSPEMESIMKSLDHSGSAGFSYLNIYYQMYKVLSEKTKERYLETKDIIFKNSNVLPKSNIQDFHFYLMNSLHTIDMGNLSGHKETIEIMDSLIRHNAITDIKNDKLAIHIFEKYTTNCFMLKDSEKLKMFADRYIEKLEPEHKENVKNHVNFMISFINQDFREALNYLSLLDIPYVTLKLIIRCQKAQCMYEIDDYEMFLNEYDNTKHFVSNNAFLLDNHKTQLNNIFSHIKRLFILRQDFNEYEFLKLEKDIQETYRDTVVWFNEKLNELKKDL